MNLKVLTAIAIAWCAPAGAADLYVEKLTAVVVNGNADTPIKVGDRVAIECTGSRELAAGENFKKALGNARGRIYIDQGSLPSTHSYPMSVTGTWTATTGAHRIRCDLDFKNMAVESNESNNSVEIVVNVRNILREGGSGPQTAAAGAVLPSNKSKACKATLYSTVRVDQSQFTAFEGVPDSNPAKMTLDLIASHGLGNFVHCEYLSVGKDVKLVYTFACANAHQAGGKHVYACE
jgi:hypothetical protein